MKAYDKINFPSTTAAEVITLSDVLKEKHGFANRFLTGAGQLNTVS